MGEQILLDGSKVKVMRISHVEKSGEDGRPKFIFELFLGGELHAKIETDQIQFDDFMVNFIKEKLQFCKCDHEEGKCRS